MKDLVPGQELPVGGASPLQIKGQTLRQIAHVSLGGPRVRVVLSNSLGTLPLRIGAAHVALRDSGASIVAASDHVLTYGGLPRPIVPPGALLISDPVDLTVPDSGDLVVDLYLPDDMSAWKSPVSLHPASWQVNYISEPGDHAGAATFPVAGTTAYRRGDGLASASSFFLSRVEVIRPDAAGVLVAFGDSITDGTQSGIDQNRRWPDLLAGRKARRQRQRRGQRHHGDHQRREKHCADRKRQDPDHTAAVARDLRVPCTVAEQRRQEEHQHQPGVELNRRHSGYEGERRSPDQQRGRWRPAQALGNPVQCGDRDQHRYDQFEQVSSMHGQGSGIRKRCTM